MGIPADLQWRLLERNTSEKIVERVKEVKKIKEITSKKDKGTLYDPTTTIGILQNNIYVGSRYHTGEGKEGYIATFYDSGDLIEEDTFLMKQDYKSTLGLSAFFSIVGIGVPFLLHNLRPSVSQRAKKTKEFFDIESRIYHANMIQIEELAAPIEVHQGSIDEVERITGRSLKAVDTKQSEKYIAGGSIFIKAEAALLGADAIVHYQSHAGTGTPVEYLD
ncbi:hypothetical protein CMI45_02160 [Candidatus Pacearchaeota archaeon]|nr:hypothetical protein [Candidatus Pacearchaeota archaeon]|tara:strand:+ start:65 stop:724 length:660 start_codon:yes stop_codon:yes gene_type:complete